MISTSKARITRLALILALPLSLPLSCVTASLAEATTVVNDVTNINPIAVERVIRPKTLDEIKSAVKSHVGPISIAGGRYSMGGQTATENALQIDMKSFNRVLALDVEAKKIVVQAGITWRDVQEHIDPHGLSLRIMQTYSNFTVGGSLSVNAHGRYVDEGPLVHAVESIKLVLADGSEVVASRKLDPDLFAAAIGGYGGIGVITEATLLLTSNERIRRTLVQMPVSQYKDHFLKTVRDDRTAVFHNADLFPPDYSTVKIETWLKTDKPLTIDKRLIPRDQKYWLEPNAISSISTLPFGRELRAKVLEPLLKTDEIVVWRNYEASYDVAQLEPKTPRLLYTYVLQEYFVPIESFDGFLSKMRSTFTKHDVNVINVSIRHAKPDSTTYLSWSPKETFSFVVYYRQATNEVAQKKVGEWTRELVDATLSVGGTYYLPYQIHATPEQFKKAYPGHVKFFAVKRKVDPSGKFRNKLWDRHDR